MCFLCLSAFYRSGYVERGHYSVFWFLRQTGYSLPDCCQLKSSVPRSTQTSTSVSTLASGSVSLEATEQPSHSSTLSMSMLAVRYILNQSYTRWLEERDGQWIWQNDELLIQDRNLIWLPWMNTSSETLYISITLHY